MAGTYEPVMPIVQRPKTKPSGEPFTVDDPEFWMLEKDGGIRRHVHMDFPKMLYRAFQNDAGRIAWENTIVGSQREMDALDAAWKDSPKVATDFYEGLQQDIARAAAEVAHSVERMTEPAKRQYRKRSADTSDHITE